jgi:two-component system NtrC family sensor kinase
MQEYLGVIASETIRCRDIIQNLSTFAQESDSQLRDISLLESVTAAIRLLTSRAHKRNFRIVNDIGQDHTIRADANKLTQVVVNVISNSFEFSEDGGVVTLRVEHPAARGDFVRLCIGDNGPGIPQSVLPKVFDPFFTTKEVGKGAGLGLAICHKIVEEFNGTIDIISETGTGTTVLIDIPRSS